MKRTIALVLCMLMMAGLVAGCGGTKDDDVTTVPTTALPPQFTEASAIVPEGWFNFGEVDADNNVTVYGLNELVSALGETVSVSDTDAVTANLDEYDDSGKIGSITVGVNSIPVLEIAEEGKRLLYAKGGAIEDDPNAVDMTTTTGSKGGLSAPAEVPTTKKPATTSRTTTTTKKTTTLSLAKASTVPTTKKPSATTDDFAAIKSSVNANPNMSKEEKQNALRLLSYKMDKNGIFYVEHEPWQKQFGFNQIYDLASPLIQLVYGTVRIKFRYDYVYKLYTEGEKKGQVMRDLTGKPVYETDERGNPIPKDWMIQMWKGRYGLVMLGGEIGIYTKPSTQTAEHYNSAVAEEELIMAMDVYHQNLSTGKTEYLFTRGPESAWWLTGFVPGAFYDEQAAQKRSEIILVANLQFPNEDMMNQFVIALQKKGFAPGSPSRDRVESYTTSGNSVKLSWQYLDEDN
ncbi:MAG: DUF4474 domain-containing protein [Oscillospiraceae bacterium]|nr:DUF4474 domain-containing protein [Oscillospiraceae bacterium]